MRDGDGALGRAARIAAARDARVGARFATAQQVHGTRVVEHEGAWEGWLRVNEADGHFAPRRGTAMAVTIADCVPVFIAHPEGAVALLHSGWRGTAARIVERALAAFSRAGLRGRRSAHPPRPGDLRRCYEVSADVATALTGAAGERAAAHRSARAHRGARARRAACTRSRRARWCTRCDNARFFSHRAGDAGDRWA